MARKHDASPVLVTAPARTFFNDDGTIMDAPGCHGGNNFSYIRAMRQIGEETGTPVLDLFSYFFDKDRRSSAQPFCVTQTFFRKRGQSLYDLKYKVSCFIFLV